MLICVALAFGAAPGASAQGLKVEERGGVRFVHGGIGAEERAVLQAMRAEYNVHMTFAVARQGNFVADVAVSLVDGGGREVLRTVAEGPLLLAKLPPGTYAVTATFDGKAQMRKLTVRDKGRAELYLYWDDPSVRNSSDMEPGPRPAK